ncbi:hypothetical protein [Alkaliphilus oremlandii]|uniref:hypothetical protein n=1 Tax=Alkaliphilus oremlandii TaxID=461876 RepID=UPI000309CFA8|nr:hypothetical protein [Alkaliphilus oremlandii]
MKKVKTLKKALCILIILASIPFIFAGCTSGREPENSIMDDNTNLTGSLLNKNEKNRDELTLVELKNILESSNMIEVKDINGQIIGKVMEGKKINQIVENIYEFKADTDHQYSSEENVLATINFYPSNHEAIYGLIKEKFIYIEGYYFTSKNSDIKKIIDYFNINTEGEPVVGD